MSISEMLLPEFDQEMTTTRRVLERVPSDKAQWKPHEKSFPLGHLAQLVARMPGWITSALTQSHLDLSKFARLLVRKDRSAARRLRQEREGGSRGDRERHRQGVR